MAADIVKCFSNSISRYSFLDWYIDSQNYCGFVDVHRSHHRIKYEGPRKRIVQRRLADLWATLSFLAAERRQTQISELPSWEQDFKEFCKSRPVVKALKAVTVSSAHYYVVYFCIVLDSAQACIRDTLQPGVTLFPNRDSVRAEIGQIFERTFSLDVEAMLPFLIPLTIEGLLCPSQRRQWVWEQLTRYNEITPSLAEPCREMLQQAWNC